MAFGEKDVIFRYKIKVMKKDKTPRNNKNQRHGLWETYYDNGQLRYKGNYINGKHDGMLFNHYVQDKHALYINI